jgi:hypothetical protein
MACMWRRGNLSSTHGFRSTAKGTGLTRLIVLFWQKNKEADANENHEASSGRTDVRRGDLLFAARAHSYGLSKLLGNTEEHDNFALIHVLTCAE